MKYVKLEEALWFQEGPGVRTHQYTNEGTKLINVTNLQDGILNLKLTNKYISNDEANGKYSHFLCDDGDLVIASSGITRESLGHKLAFVRKQDLPLCMNTSVIRFKPNSKDINMKFVYYFLKSDKYIDQICKLMTGIAQLNYGPSHLRKVDFPLYSLEEQNEIVNKLEYIDLIIEKDRKQLKLYDELIKSRFIEMFMNKNFDTIQIRNVVDTNKISAKKVYKSEDKIKYIDISSIDNSNNVLTDFTPYIFSEAPSRAQQCLKPNDILVSTVRPNLKNIAAFNFEEENFVGSSGFCVLRSSKCNPSYLKYIVLSDDFTESMVKLTNGASYPAIRDDDVLNYEMINAPIELQNEFASFVELIDKSKFVYHSKYFLCDILTFASSTIAYSNVVSIFV